MVLCRREASHWRCPRSSGCAPERRARLLAGRAGCQHLQAQGPVWHGSVGALWGSLVVSRQCGRLCGGRRAGAGMLGTRGLALSRCWLDSGLQRARRGRLRRGSHAPHALATRAGPHRLRALSTLGQPLHELAPAHLQRWAQAMSALTSCTVVVRLQLASPPEARQLSCALWPLSCAAHIGAQSVRLRRVLLRSNTRAASFKGLHPCLLCRPGEEEHAAGSSQHAFCTARVPNLPRQEHQAVRSAPVPSARHSASSCTLCPARVRSSLALAHLVHRRLRLVSCLRNAALAQKA